MKGAKDQMTSEGFTKGKLDVDFKQRVIVVALLFVTVGIFFGSVCALLYLFALIMKFLVFIVVSVIFAF